MPGAKRKLGFRREVIPLFGSAFSPKAACEVKIETGMKTAADIASQNRGIHERMGISSLRRQSILQSCDVANRKEPAEVGVTGRVIALGFEGRHVVQTEQAVEANLVNN